MLVLGRVESNKLVPSFPVPLLLLLVEPAPQILGFSLNLVARTPRGHLYLGASLEQLKRNLGSHNSK